MEKKSVLDTALLNELREIMGEDFHRLIRSFARDGNQRIDALNQALSAGEAESARQQAHSFKGSSGNLGALRVTDLCLKIEQHAQGCDLAAAAGLMAGLASEFHQACEALHHLEVR